MALSFEEFDAIAAPGRSIEKIQDGSATLNGITIQVKVITLEGGKKCMVNLERYAEFKKGCVKNAAGGVDLGESWKIAAPRKGLDVGFAYDSSLLGEQSNTLSLG